MLVKYVMANRVKPYHSQAAGLDCWFSLVFHFLYEAKWGDFMEYCTALASSSPVCKIIDCGPVSPLMMDLSPSCWEGLSPSHFKGPERVIRRLEPLHCQWTKFITLQRAWSSSYWEGLSPSHFKEPERVIRRLEPFHCQWTQVHDIAKGLKVAKGFYLIFLHKNIMI